ncbi:indole-3-glycerol phosphate synthase TrpC [Streptomyces sp. NBC_01304]|uniref:indole-3-glycerol phosphate synthase TrpC n=1 Tax=Streptomyces sp. NBC_01304 TaxID=2903818 RepID=UPI002E165231|nr:indole-3-glycerol phosphate synthase TrpC [Streptomyces sp. NBC_01304]
MDVLATILDSVRGELRARKRQVPLEVLVRQALSDPPRRDALDALRCADGVRVIAEVKRASPSQGALSPSADAATLAAAYQCGGAAAVSVLTQQRYFCGDLSDLDAVRSAVDIPVLRKDFIIDEYQLWEARAHGADLVLLIVAALDQPTLSTLVARAHAMGLTALVEVHDAGEVERALDAGARVIGVNARDLHTLRVHSGRFAELAPGIPDDVVRVAESGVQGAADVRALAAAGADAVLVGTHVATAPDPRDAVAQLVSAGRCEADSLPAAPEGCRPQSGSAGAGRLSW